MLPFNIKRHFILQKLVIEDGSHAMAGKKLKKQNVTKSRIPSMHVKQSLSISKLNLIAFNYIKNPKYI